MDEQEGSEVSLASEAGASEQRREWARVRSAEAGAHPQRLEVRAKPATLVPWFPPHTDPVHAFTENSSPAR